MNIVIYHGDDCNDGFCCALLARQVWPDCILYGARYGDAPPSGCDGLNVLLADFSYPRDVLVNLRKRCNQLVVLDHHKTAQANCETLDFCTFDMNKCGAQLVNDYLYENFRVRWWPDFVEYVADRDLWKKQLPDNDAFHAWLTAQPKTIKAWFEAAESFCLNDDWKTAGQAILSAMQRNIERMMAFVKEQDVGGVIAPVLNNTDRAITSDLLHRMCEVWAPDRFAALWWQEKDRTVWSLRSLEGGMDVSEIARKYGGGGHKHAAGFQTP